MPRVNLSESGLPLNLAIPTEAFVLDVPLGEIDVQDTKDITITDSRFAVPDMPAGYVLPIRGLPVQGSSEQFMVGSVVLDNAELGTVIMQVYNPYAASVDFGDRYVYFEVLPLAELP